MTLLRHLIKNRLFLYQILVQDEYQSILKEYLEKSFHNLYKNILGFGKDRLGDIITKTGAFYTKEDTPFFKILLLTQLDSILCFLK